MSELTVVKHSPVDQKTPPLNPHFNQPATFQNTVSKAVDEAFGIATGSNERAKQVDQVIRCKICLKSLQGASAKERYNRRCYSCPLPKVDELGDHVWDVVIEDMKLRDQFGTKKYGKPLFINDGRDTLQDAYEEALDLAVYLKKAIMERKHADNQTAQRTDHDQGDMRKEGTLHDQAGSKASQEAHGEDTP